MKDFLAERLLAKIMSWRSEEISLERPLIQALASFKYNEYQQYSTGIRFTESLVRWLNQFETLEERKVAYNFIKEKLIYISPDQLNYLVSIAFNDKIDPFIVKKTSLELNCDEFQIKKIKSSNSYKTNLRRCLFIGLSDGSRIDYLRRSCALNNEQVFTTHELSKEKLQEISNDLYKDTSSEYFNTVFLIDDFTASGISFFRPNEEKGKIFKFLDKVFKETEWKTITNSDDLAIHILFYIATSEAISNLENLILTWKMDKNLLNEINVSCIQLIDHSSRVNWIEDHNFLSIAEKYFNPEILNKHYKKGKIDRPFLGFNECALPIILSHNTPNNSLPILWYSPDMKYIGLFPRITRHKA